MSGESGGGGGSYKTLNEADFLRFTTHVATPPGIRWLRRKEHVSGDGGVPLHSYAIDTQCLWAPITRALACVLTGKVSRFGRKEMINKNKRPIPGAKAKGAVPIVQGHLQGITGHTKRKRRT